MRRDCPLYVPAKNDFEQFPSTAFSDVLGMGNVLSKTGQLQIIKEHCDGLQSQFST